MLLMTYVNSSVNGKPFRSEGDVSRRIVVDAGSEWAGAGHVAREQSANVFWVGCNRSAQFNCATFLGSHF